MRKTKMLGLLYLFRFELPLAAGICVLFGQLLALGKFPSAHEMLLGFLGVFTLSAAALIINDYFDLETDRINAPHRPLPSGIVTTLEVVTLFGIVSALGLLASFLIGWLVLLVAFIVWMVGFLYNWRFKKAGFLGNLMVSFSVGMTFIFGGISVGQPFERSVWFFAVLSLLINLGEEIAADAMDIEGDQRAGSRSLPVMLGRENALRVSAGIFLLVCAISSLPFLFGWMAWMELIPILLMDMVIIISTAKLLDTRLENRRIYIRWIYLSASAAILLCIIIRMVA